MRRFPTALPRCLLAFALLLQQQGMCFRMVEDSWVDGEAVVPPHSGNELQFYKEEWEPMSTVLHLSPPAGEPAWQPGQKVAISFYRPGAGNTCLRADKPAAWSGWMLLSGGLLLCIAVPLAIATSIRQRQAAPPADERPEPPKPGCLLAFMSCLGYACCVMAVWGLCLLISELHYNPDPNAAVACGLGAILFWLLPGVMLLGVSRVLLHCARRGGLKPPPPISQE